MEVLLVGLGVVGVVILIIVTATLIVDTVKSAKRADAQLIQDKEIAEKQQETALKIEALQEATEWAIAKQQQETEQQIAVKQTGVTMDEEHEVILQEYMHSMSDLLANDLFFDASLQGIEVRAGAQAQTIAVLRELDPNRKVILLQFLYDSSLVQVDHPVIDLSTADLSSINLNGADLRGINLAGTNMDKAKMHESCLNRANLSEANLRGAIFSGAYLIEADLHAADLSDADLRGANLIGADLRGADLKDALLAGADLSGASLHGAQVHHEQLRSAHSHKGATLV